MALSGAERAVIEQRVRDLRLRLEEIGGRLDQVSAEISPSGASPRTARRP